MIVWHTLSLAEQLGNIGGEVYRAMKWKEKNRADLAKNALFRALELFDLSLTDKRWKGRLKEICRAREVVCDFLAGDNCYKSEAVSLQKFFDAYATYARRDYAAKLSYA